MENQALRLAMLALALCHIQCAVGKGRKADGFEPVTVKKKIEPIYPGWAYQNGIGEGFAKLAFYVDENGVASEHTAIEYSHKAFAESLLRTVKHWKFEPAYRQGQAVASVCQAYWEFLPDRPIVTNALFDTGKRMEGLDDHDYRELQYFEEEELDHKLKMVAFPVVEGASSVEAQDLQDSKVKVTCEFYVDTEGSVALPMVLRSSAPVLNDALQNAFKEAVFERPLHEGKPAVALLRKTYLIHVSLD